MSESWTDTARTLRRWRQTRLPHGLFVSTAAVLVLASAVGQHVVWTTIVGRLAVAYGAVAVLRLWDDLEDRQPDRRDHPDRVWLAPAGRIAAGVALGAAAVAAWSPLGFIALYAALSVFYRSRATPLEAVLLLKYPVLVVLLRASVDWEGCAAMALVYGGTLLDARQSGPVQSGVSRGARLAAVAATLIVLHGMTR